jgi:long-subunit acyl-CoA synthetase (AMP-forming)
MEAATKASVKGGLPPAAHAATLAQAFRITAAERLDDVAIRTKGDAFTLTWGELRERVDALAGGLAELGLGRGETVALMLTNRPEFHICDLAAMMLGATPFSIYNTYTAEQISYLVQDADAHVLICEQQFLAQVTEARRELPGLSHVIVVDGERSQTGVRQSTLTLADVEAMNPAFEVEESVARIEAGDVLTLIYTSGTTGPPKGVQLVHRNLLAACEGLDTLIEFPSDGRTSGR